MALVQLARSRMKQDLLSDAQAAVDIQSVRKTYLSARGPIEALRETTLRILPQQFISIVGPSGCGKSTLLSLVAGLDKPSSGQVSINGENVKGPHPSLGVVFQRDLLFDWRTVLDNVLIQIEMRGLRRADYVAHAEKLLDMVGLSKFKDRRPRELSGGMRQRVAICRALVHNPALLLMDEPFGALDAITRDRLNVDLNQICKETSKTVIFITHSLSEAVFLGDRVVVMSSHPGRVVADIPVDYPHPRTLSFRETSEYMDCTRQVRQVFEEEGIL